MSENQSPDGTPTMGGLPHDLTPDGAPGGPVASGAYCYLVATGDWMFDSGDKVFGTPASKHFHVTTDGPYSTVTLAEQAADARLSLIRSDMVTVRGQMEPYASGLRGPHGGVVSWKRDLTWHDFTGVHGDQDGWQQISLVYVDEMP